MMGNFLMKKTIFFVVIIVFLLTCRQDTDFQKGDQTGEGLQLAKTYCVSCHKLPTPSSLDRNTWEKYVLPRMGNMLGIYENQSQRMELIHSSPGGLLVEKANVFPDVPVLKKSDWEAIVAYYLMHAPENLEVPESPTIKKQLSQFKVQIPGYRLSPPSSTLVQFSTLQKGLLLGDANSKAFYQFNERLEMEKAAKVKEGAVSLIERPEAFFVTVMGQFSPSDDKQGFLMMLPKNEQQKPVVLIDSLQRPVHTTLEDLDGNGYADFVISEFAKWTGGLSWWQNDGRGGFVKRVLRNKPGAIKSEIRDFNKDGKPDILALFGQGDEGFFLYSNQGDGTFSEEMVLQFEPSFGSSSFDLLDFNQDEYVDIVYTAGDNADYPPVIKPYHGIYFYEGQSDGSFKQSLFIPLPGAYRAIVRDFDQDGDLDIAAISFFPDFQKSPIASFVYYQNLGDLNFESFTFEEVNSGRWLVMDDGDYDQDGDLDLILGSLTFEVIPKTGLVEQWVGEGIPFVLLQNQLK